MKQFLMHVGMSGGGVAINSYGFRDNEYPINKDKDAYRIVVIGDSITFGNGVSVEDTFPKQLEVFFKQEGRNIEVLNLGLGGYDTLQEVATLEDIGLQFSPDLVVVGYCVNDISIVSPNLDYIQRAQRYSSPIYKLRLFQLVRVNLDKIALKAFTEKMQSDSEFTKKYQPYIADISKDDGVCALVNDLMDIEKKYGDHYMQ